MTTLRVDVAVVGAGPSGAAAAYHLSRAGVRVALMDRASFPRAKVCGDGLTPRALAEIDAMGALSDLRSGFPIDSLVTVDLTDGREHRGPVPSLTSSSASMVVPRTELDDALRRAAERAGARFSPRTNVNCLLRRGNSIVGTEAQTPEGLANVRASVTVVSEGSSNRLGRLVRPGRRVGAVGVAVRQYFRLRAPLEAAFRIYVPLTGEAAPLCGYGWVFPVSAELANVGVGCFLPQHGAPSLRLRRVFTEFLVALGRVEPRIVVSASCGRLEGGVIDTSLSVPNLIVPGALLVGDAAGAANPFTGEGIAQALESGRAAAEAIVEHLDRGRPLATAYVDRLAAHFPDRSEWTTWLPWLSERGGVRTREFLEIISGRVGTLGRSVRSAVLEQGRACAVDGSHASEPAPSGSATTTWTRAERTVAGRHPMLARLLSIARVELAAHADPAVEAFWAGAGRDGEELALPVALLTLMGLIARDVVDHGAAAAGQPLSPRTSWAVNAMNLGAADLLVAECFSALAAVPGLHAASFAHAARRMFAKALSDELAGTAPSRPTDMAEHLRTVAAQLGGTVARARSARRVRTRQPLSADTDAAADGLSAD